jgi:mono/diheme cytochrome c family protein
VNGIGAWSDNEFVRALRDGIAPDGSYYFPAFPFPAFTGMTDRDILDIKAYLFTQAPVEQTNKPAATPIPRFAMAIWRALCFSPGPLSPDPKQSAEWNRGAYLATAVAHCGECHTPRNLLGDLDTEHAFAGADLADGSKKHAPNITSDRGSGIGKWSKDDLVTLLTTRMKPNGDFVAQPMSEVVDGVTKLSETDRRDRDLYQIAARDFCRAELILLLRIGCYRNSI